MFWVLGKSKEHILKSIHFSKLLVLCRIRGTQELTSASWGIGRKNTLDGWPIHYRAILKGIICPKMKIALAGTSKICILMKQKNKYSPLFPILASRDWNSRILEQVPAKFNRPLLSSGEKDMSVPHRDARETHASLTKSNPKTSSTFLVPTSGWALLGRSWAHLCVWE